MKLNFSLPKDEGVARHFCISCQKETIVESKKDDAPWYSCTSCGHASKRTLVFGKNARMFLDHDHVLWHETVAVFVFNSRNEILCFERTHYPVGLITVPAGHAELNKTIKESAEMELKEESGISGVPLKLQGKEEINGDSCSWGSDDHVWHVYVVQCESEPKILLNEEGRNVLWLAPQDMLKRKCTIGVEFCLKKYFTQ